MLRFIRNSKHIRYCAILISAFFITLIYYGCAGLGKKLEPPRINLSNITIQKLKTFETAFSLKLRVFNTNDIPLVIKALNCDLDVNGRRLATGVTKTETTIPAMGTGVVDLTVYASSLQIVSNVLEGLKKSETDQDSEFIDYELSGQLHLGGRALPSKIPFTATGDLSIDRFLYDREKTN